MYKRRNKNWRPHTGTDWQQTGKRGPSLKLTWQKRDIGRWKGPSQKDSIQALWQLHNYTAKLSVINLENIQFVFWKMQFTLLIISALWSSVVLFVLKTDVGNRGIQTLAGCCVTIAVMQALSWHVEKSHVVDLRANLLCSLHIYCHSKYTVDTLTQLSIKVDQIKVRGIWMLNSSRQKTLPADWPRACRWRLSS